MLSWPWRARANEQTRRSGKLKNAPLFSLSGDGIYVARRSSLCLLSSPPRSFIYVCTQAPPPLTPTPSTHPPTISHPGKRRPGVRGKAPSLTGRRGGRGWGWGWGGWLGRRFEVSCDQPFSAVGCGRRSNLLLSGLIRRSVSLWLHTRLMRVCRPAIDAARRRHGDDSEQRNPLRGATVSRLGWGGE